MKPASPLEGKKRCVTWWLFWSQVIPSQLQQSMEGDQLRGGRWGEKVEKFEEKDKRESLSSWLQEEETWTMNKVRKKVVFFERGH